MIIRRLQHGDKRNDQPAASACAIKSRGGKKVTSSSTVVSVSTIANGLNCSNRPTISSTTLSGVDAPLVTPTVLNFDHCESTSSGDMIKNAGTPNDAATSRNLFELLLVCEPTTTTRSQAFANSFTAPCRFVVA